MHGTLVYSNPSFSSTDGTIHLNHHTTSIYILNTSTTSYGTVTLNSVYNINIPPTPSGGPGVYVEVPGDYVSISAVTAGINFAVYAVG